MPDAIEFNPVRGRLSYTERPTHRSLSVGFRRRQDSMVREGFAADSLTSAPAR